MKKLPQNPYILVGRCLAPVLNSAQKATLAKDLFQTTIPWGDLLAVADRQLCAPLWHLRLGEHGLRDLLPEALQAQLAQAADANRSRNRRLKTELIEATARLAARGIPVLLLKGAATLVDGLYADAGARLMRDLDLLIPDDMVARAQRILCAAGYGECPARKARGGHVRLSAHDGHLPALRHPEKCAVVELHFKVAYGQCGRVMTTRDAWRASTTDELDGLPVRYLAPTQRLLNNAMHAALPHLRFVRGSFALRDLAEFAALVHRYGPDIDRAPLFAVVEAHRLQSEFTTYAHIAHLLMQTDFSVSTDISTIAHTRRILKTAGLRPPATMAAFAGQAFAKIYFCSRLPRWAKQNFFNGDESQPGWRRLGTLASSLFNARFSP